MATSIENCPFCDGDHLHISRHLMSHSVVCQTCRSTGPHRRLQEDAVLEWNQTSKLLGLARVGGERQVHGRLHELEDAVRNLAGALRKDQANDGYFNQRTREREMEH
jgi:hypothetical protein